MLATIAICTHNRADTLPMAVRAAAAADWPAADFEVLVIDNGCTDATPEVAAQLAAAHPNVRVVREDRLGLCPARNRAAAEARGRFVAFVDDDAEIAPDYLRALDRLAREERSWGCAGGVIEVGWLSPPPPWWEPGLDFIFNFLYVGSFRRPLAPPEIVYGTNMVFPTRLLRRIGGFDETIGLRGDLHGRPRRMLTGDDTELQYRLYAMRRRVIWEPALRVRHWIRPDRVDREYLRRRAETSGRSLAVIERKHPRCGARSAAVFGVAECIARRLLGRTRGAMLERYFWDVWMAYWRERLGLE